MTIEHHYTPKKKKKKRGCLQALQRLTIQAGGTVEEKLWNYRNTVHTIAAATLSTVHDQNKPLDNQLLGEMIQVLYKTVTVHCRVWTSAHFPLTIGFVDASQFNLIWNVFQLLFICLFTCSHKSSVLFLSLCVLC